MWKKRNEALKTVEDVILSNSNMPTMAAFNDLTPSNITNMDKMIDRLKQLSSEGKTITVFADYDADGVCSALVIALVLKTLGLRMAVKFPHRSTGYGLHKEDVEKINSNVILTIDNGIAAFEAVNAAKAKGIEVLTIDHHLQTEDGVPAADLIIDPHVYKNNANDFEDWCAAGLAYEMAKRVCSEEDQIIALQFACIATIADVVPLMRDNRKIVIDGLEQINQTKIPALKKLINAISGFGSRFVDEKTIGFKIAPIINAMSRINDDAEYVFKYFLTGDSKMLEELMKVNETRKQLVAIGVSKAYQQISDECMQADVPLVLYLPTVAEGVVGIIAGRLAEELRKPVICLTNSSTPGIVKGSARSVASINIKETLDKVSDLLENHGGHAGAAGLGLQEENIDALRSRFAEMFADYEIDDEDTIVYDLEIDAKDLLTTAETLKKFAPYGEGNPQPVFKVKNYQLFPRNGVYHQAMGPGMKTVKLFGNQSNCVGFGMVEKYTSTGLARHLDIIGTISINHFSKTPEVQVEMVDLVKVNPTTVSKSKLSNLLASQLVDGFSSF